MQILHYEMRDKVSIRSMPICNCVNVYIFSIRYLLVLLYVKPVLIYFVWIHYLNPLPCPKHTFYLYIFVHSLHFYLLIYFFIHKGCLFYLFRYLLKWAISYSTIFLFLLFILFMFRISRFWSFLTWILLCLWIFICCWD